MEQRVIVVHEDGAWDAHLPGLPIAGSGASPALLVDDLVAAVREYAEDWHARLHAAPNHVHARPFVDHVDRCDDAALRAWLARATV